MRGKSKPTQAQLIMDARHSSYARYSGGMMDETDLLLMQQHYGELAERERATAKPHRYRSNPARAKAYEAEKAKRK